MESVSPLNFVLMLSILVIGAFIALLFLGRGSKFTQAAVYIVMIVVFILLFLRFFLGGG